jgi:hypothetical protein
MVYDEHRGKFVALYAKGESPEMLTLESGPDGLHWVERFPQTEPTGIRVGHRLVYDPVRQSVLCLFGLDLLTGSSFNDVWEWDGNNWTQIVPQTQAPLPPPFTTPPLGGVAPHPRGLAMVEADRRINRIVVYGGVFGSSAVLTDLWELDTSNLIWRPVNVLTPGYDAPFTFSLETYCFNPASQRIAIWDDGINMLWELDRGRFRRMIGSFIPSTGLLRGFVTSDFARGRMLAFFVVPNRRRVFSWSDQLDVIVEESGPSESKLPQYFGRPLLDLARERVVMWLPSGQGMIRNHYGEIWTLDLSEGYFELADDSLRTPEMLNPALVHDTGRDRFLVIGPGESNAALMDTWEFSPETGYRRIETQTHVPSRPNRFGVCKHIGTDRIVLFGGYFGPYPVSWGSPDPRTWTFDGNDWNGHDAWPRPNADSLVTMCYDSVRDRVLAFEAGRFSNPDRMWSWDGTAWILLPPPPGAVDVGWTAFDRARDRLVMQSNPMLEYDPVSGWTTVPIPGSDTRYSRLWHYAPEFGGIVSTSQYFPTIATDTRLWSGSAWSTLHPGGSTPGGFTDVYIPDGTAQRLNIAAYDPERQRIVEMGTFSSRIDDSQIFERETIRFATREVRRGSTLTLTYDHPADAGSLWVPVFGLDPTGTFPVKPSPWSPLVYTSLPLAPDPLFLASLTTPIVRNLDGNGQTSISIPVPNDPLLDFLELHAASLTFSATGIDTISNRTTVRIVP